MKDIIFDIGNVLLSFKPLEFLEGIFGPGDITAGLNEAIFLSPEWPKLDAGLITQEEAASLFCSRRPQLGDSIALVMDRWFEMLTPLEDSVKLLYSLSEKGHRLFYLSNYHKKAVGYILGRYGFFSLFENGIFSCDEHCIKPQPEIYERFLKKTGLAPENCVFIDDTPQNVDAASQFGMAGILFEGAEKLKGDILLLSK